MVLLAAALTIGFSGGPLPLTASALSSLLEKRRGAIDAFDTKVEALLKSRQTVGCAIVYAEKGKVVFAKGYGFANLEHQVKMRPDHLHELASVSKQFTSAAILQLAEVGKLQLDDPIRKFFPEAGDAWGKVRIRHLLNHTGGLPDYLASVDPGDDVTRKQLIDSVKDKPLRFEPGSKFEYSNSGYMVLGQIVEKVSTLDMGAYLKSKIFEPAGMKTAVLNDTSTVFPNRADGYAVRAGKVMREGYTSPSLSKTGDGQIMCSALDLAAWDAALRGTKVLSAASLSRLSTKPGLNPEAEKAKYYGYGVGVVVDGAKTVHQHGGGWMGTNTLFVRYLDDGKCVVILCNSEGAPTQDLLAEVEDRFLGRRIVAPPKKP